MVKYMLLHVLSVILFVMISTGLAKTDSFLDDWHLSKSLDGHKLTVVNGDSFNLSCTLRYTGAALDLSRLGIQVVWLEHKPDNPQHVLYSSIKLNGSRNDPRVKVYVRYAPTSMTTCMVFSRTDLTRDPEEMVVGCLFAFVNTVSLKAEMAVRIVRKLEVITSLKGHRFTLMNGDDLKLSCKFNFDPRLIAFRTVRVMWSDKRKNSVLYTTLSMGKNCSRVEATVKPTKYFVESFLNIPNVNMASDTNQMTIECAFILVTVDLRFTKKMQIDVVSNWKIKTTLRGGDLHADNGGNFKLGCKLNFDPRRVNSQQVDVVWRDWKQRIILYTTLDRGRNSSRVRVSVKRRKYYIKTSLTFRKATVARDSKLMILTCKFLQKHGFVFKARMRVHIVTSMREICGRQPLFPLPKNYRIIGGRNARPGEIPWQAELLIKGNGSDFLCGASVIHMRWLLTAAHCIPRKETRRWRHAKKMIRVVVGSLNPTEDTSGRTRKYFHVQVPKIKRIILHRYNRSPLYKFNNDIALLELRTPLRFDDFTQPICLPQRNDEFVGRICRASGWGRKTATNPHAEEELKLVDLPIINVALCQNLLLRGHRTNRINPRRNICTLYPAEGRDTCKGDSGGPLACMKLSGQFALVGITSFGISCAQKNNPSVLTNVAKYVPWIRRKTRLNF